MAKKTTAAKKTAKKTVRKTVQKAVRKVAGKAARKPAVAKAAPVAKKPTGLIGDVQTLMEMMAAHEVTEIHIEDPKRMIKLRRGPETVAVASGPVAMAAPVAAAPVAAAPVESAPAEDLLEIRSPMVGTFYSAPSPDSDAYTKVGAKVDDESVVCIVEAMKVMNEIKAECGGTIAEICVKNAQPVEFGQVLFKVRP